MTALEIGGLLMLGWLLGLITSVAAMYRIGATMNARKKAAAGVTSGKRAENIDETADRVLAKIAKEAERA